jgi:hydrogenase-4 component E
MLTSFVDPLLMVALVLNFFALGASRIRAVIRAISIQGALLGLLPLLVHADIGVRVLLLVVGTITIKGFVIPGLLYHALREVNIQREVQPLVGHIASLLLAAVGTGLAMVFAHTLPLADEDAGLLLVPASLSTALTGFLMLTTRQKAIMQVVGYLLLENGIFIFGLLLLEAMPFLVEVGVLLDLFAGVFVMGIIIHHINREFASVSTLHLTELKE